jgi:tyrosyl-tRNA synthetase
MVECSHMSLSVQEILNRQVAQILPSKKGLEQLMQKQKIRLYLGIDPTGSNLHLGHTIALRKLQQFALLGQEVFLVIGTGTVLAGDPSQREQARPKITKKEIEQNMKTWKKQAAKVLDFSKVKLVYNGDWLLKLKYADLLTIGSYISASQLFQRDMFQRRLKKGDTVWVHELLYPLLQGYDSVALDVDLEIGGTDQVFNMLVGRELQRKMNNREKYVLTVPMIKGLDGKTMSKTSGNTVNIADNPQDMFGKLMTLRDELVEEYFELCTDISTQEVQKFKEALSKRDLKAYLAKEIVSLYHGKKAAEKAEQEFAQVFQKKEQPTDVPKVAGAGLFLVDFLVQTKLASSKSEAKRLISQAGVQVNEVVEKDPMSKVPKNSLVQVGKRRFVKTA